MDTAQNKRLPLISILITSYNREKWIAQAIESAMAQDYANLEIVICDDASTDNTDSVIRKYLHDPRIKYSRNQENIGMIANFNKTFFELAQGEYVTQLGSDDFLVNPRFISLAADIIQKYDNIALVFGKTNWVDQDGRPKKMDIPKQEFTAGFLEGKEAFMDYQANPYVYATSGAVVYSLNHLKANKIFFEGRITADIELNLQLMLHGNVGFIMEDIYNIRVHNNNASSSFKNLEELDFSYLDLMRVLYNQAKPLLNQKKLDKWYSVAMTRNLERCIYLVLDKADRYTTSRFHQMLLKKYRKEYFRLLTIKPKFFVKLILNR